MYGVIQWRAALPWRRALRQLPLTRGVTMFMAPAGLMVVRWRKRQLLHPDGAPALTRGVTVFMAPAGITPLVDRWLLLDPDGAPATNRRLTMFMAPAAITLTRRVRATETVTIIGKRYASPGITRKTIERRPGP